MPLVLENADMTLSLDELALSVYEFVQPTPDYRAKHRYQQLRVIRKDRVVKFTWDMGDRGLYNREALYCATGVIYTKDGECHAAPMRIPYSRIRSGGIVPMKRVGDVMDLADEMRAETAPEQAIPDQRDILDAYLRQLDEIQQWKAYRSTFGPFGAITRN